MTVDDGATPPGPYLHGTAAVLQPGDELVAGHRSHFRPQQALRHVYFTSLESTAAWGAQLAEALQPDDDGAGAGTAGGARRGRIYEVEPLGAFEDDPNVTDKKFPGNPTRSYRSLAPLRVVREVERWEPHPPEAVAQMLQGLQRLRAEGRDVIED